MILGSTSTLKNWDSLFPTYGLDRGNLQHGYRYVHVQSTAKGLSRHGEYIYNTVVSRKLDKSNSKQEELRWL